MIALQVQFDFSSGQQALDDLRRAAAKSLERAVEFICHKAKEAVSVPNPPVKVRGRTTFPTPSRPGEPPRMRTGWGRRMIDWQFDAQALTGSVFVHRSARYMATLEFGTFRIAARPWLFMTCMQHMNEFRKLATPAMEVR